MKGLTKSTTDFPKQAAAASSVMAAVIRKVRGKYEVTIRFFIDDWRELNLNNAAWVCQWKF
jgi:hypothetical protein